MNKTRFDSTNQMAMDRACGDNGRLIYRLVSWSFKKWGGDQHELDDRRQIARMAFLRAKETHDPSRGEFERYAKYVVGRELFEHVRTLARRRGYAQVQTFTDYGQSVDSTADRSVLADLMLDVGEDAQAILDLLFDPQPFWSPCRTVTIKSLVKFLAKKMHWDKPRVRNSLSEIEAALT